MIRGPSHEKLKSVSYGFSLVDFAGGVAHLQRNGPVDVGELLVVGKVAQQSGQQQLVLFLYERKRLNFVFDEAQQLVLLYAFLSHFLEDVLPVVSTEELHSQTVYLHQFIGVAHHRVLASCIVLVKLLQEQCPFSFIERF